MWTSDVIAQNTGLYQVLVKLRFNDAQTADGQGYLYTKTSSNEFNKSKTFSYFEVSLSLEYEREAGKQRNNILY